MQIYISDTKSEPLKYILHSQPSSKKLIICNGATATEEELYKADIIDQFHLYLKKKLESMNDINNLATKLLLKNPHVIILCDDMSHTPIPFENHTSLYQKKVTHICMELIKRSQKVVRLCENQPTIVKDKPHTLLCAFIRHGKTIGNLNRRYIGTTNEPLCKEGVLELKKFQEREIYPSTHLLYVSPLTRCIETAKVLYPNQPMLSCSELRECDFGEFENKNYMELQSHPYYQKWVDSNGQLPFPNGETPAIFTKRCIKGFLSCINHIPYKASFTHDEPTWITFIVHGGTIMSILSELSVPKNDYFSFKVKNGQGYLCEYDLNNQVLTILDVIN